MPAKNIHEALSYKRTGKHYALLHEWIDEAHGIDHRRRRHYYSEQLHNFVRDNFGGHEAVSEWLFHIALDNLDTLVKNERLNNLSELNFYKFGFGENGYVYYDDCVINDLESEFN